MKNFWKIFIIAVAFLAVFFLSRKDVWMGFYYPNGCLSCEDKYIFSSEFETKKECLAWANNLKSSRMTSSDDFECGLNCKEVGYKMYRCEETVDY